MSAIILPKGYTFEDRSRLEAEAIHEMSLFQRYDSDENFRRKVDLIHELALGAGKRCVACMEGWAKAENRERR